ASRAFRRRFPRRAATAEPLKPTRLFRFGVNVRTAGSAAEWAEKARKVERLGYAVLLVPDHLTDLLAPFPALAAAAAATTRLRIGTALLNNDFPHPVLTAREAATLDVLSDGRFELGLGAGHMQSEYEQLGLAFDGGATRVGRLAEALVIVKALLGGEPLSFTGRHYRVTGQTIHPRPVQRPRPPIFIGGNAPRLLQVAATEADIVGLTGIAFRRGGAKPHVSDFREGVVDERVQLVREMAGERAELNALVQRVIVTDDRRKVARELAEQWPPLTPDDILASPYILVGTPEQMADDLRARRERW